MSISKKILIGPNGWEAYIRSVGGTNIEMDFYWQKATDILKHHRAATISVDSISDKIIYDTLRTQEEILDLNGFDYSQSEPDYTVIITELMSQERPKRVLAYPPGFAAVIETIPVIDPLGVHLLNDVWVSERDFAPWSMQEPIGTLTPTVEFRQPFYFNVVATDETTADADDGTITINDAWGGPGPLEYSINDGSSWQASNSFTGLADGTYQVKVRDANTDESFARETVIQPGA